VKTVRRYSGLMLILSLMSSYRVRHGACLLSIKKLIFGTFDFVLLQPFSCCVVSSSLVLQNLRFSLNLYL